MALRCCLINFAISGSMRRRLSRVFSCPAGAGVERRCSAVIRGRLRHPWCRNLVGKRRLGGGVAHAPWARHHQKAAARSPQAKIEIIYIPPARKTCRLYAPGFGIILFQRASHDGHSRYCGARATKEEGGNSEIASPGKISQREIKAALLPGSNARARALPPPDRPPSSITASCLCRAPYIMRRTFTKKNHQQAAVAAA